MSEIRTYRLDIDTKNTILGKIEAFFRSKTEVEFAYVYGSFLGANIFRDMDIGVYVDETKVRDIVKSELGLEGELERYLGVKIPLDVRIINKSHVAYAYNVLKGRLIFNRNDRKRVNFSTYVLSRYFDLEPVLSYHQKEAFVP